jgi:replicative DNA helicase
MAEQRIPPQNLEAEASLLGSLLIDRDAIVKIADLVVPEDFYREAHQKIYIAMLDLFRALEPIDALSVGNRLKEQKLLEAVGGRAAIVELSNAVPTASHVAHYATIVSKKATLRRLIAAATNINTLGYEEAENVDTLIDRAEQQLFAVSQKYLKRTFVPIQDVLSGAFERIDDLHKEKGKMRGISTGFAALDHLLAGLQPSDLVVLAARPSVGKTTLAMDIARLTALKSKVPVGIFSLEMSKEQLVDRLLCAEADVPLWRMRTGKLGEEGDDFSRIGEALNTLSEAPVFIDDSPSGNIMEIRAKARRLQMEHGLGLLIVDYLQLMESHGKIESRVQEVAEMTRGLKAIARELSIPVLALSQLSRAVEMSKPAIPKLAHLRESGSIEQDADVVLFIYRKSVDKNYRLDDIAPDERGIAEIHIAKHRNGPTGMVKLFFDEEKVTFRNLETHHVETGGATEAMAEPF